MAGSRFLENLVTGGSTPMSLPFGHVDTTFESFLQELPEDYQELALEFKAFTRSRKIQTVPAAGLWAMK